MAHTAPIILAFILNCCEIFVFRNIFNVSYSPHAAYIAKDIFSVGNYFLLLNMKLYPRGFRRAHWIPRSFVEFILAVYCLETFLCDFWYPLEHFTHGLFQNLILFIKKESPKKGPVCVILCNLVEILSKKEIPEGISVALSAFLSLIIIHGTRTIDLGILRHCGVKDFVIHLKDQICNAAQNFIESLTNFTKSCKSKSSSRPTLVCGHCSK